MRLTMLPLILSLLLASVDSDTSRCRTEASACSLVPERNLSVEELAPLCEEKDLDACFFLALKQATNEDWMDVVRKVTLLRSVCDEGHFVACGVLAELLGEREMEVNDAVSEETVRLAEKGCQQKAGSACGVLARLLFTRSQRNEEPKPTSPPCVALRRGCELHDVEACFAYGKVCDAVFGLAYRSLREQLSSCEGGAAQACSVAASHFANSPVLPQDLERAVALHEMACSHGVESACVEAARLHLGGRLGKAIRPEEVPVLLSKACGRSVSEDCVEGSALLPLQAEQLLADGCERGNARACAELGKRRTGEAALTLLRKSCALGHLETCLQAGHLARSLGKVAEAVGAFSQACHHDLAAGCEEARRWAPDAEPLVQATTQVSLEGGEGWLGFLGESDLLFLKRAPFLVVFSSGRLLLVDAIQGVLAAPVLELSSEAVKWRGPPREMTLQTHIWRGRLSSRAERPGLWGVVSGSGAQVHFWHPERGEQLVKPRTALPYTCLMAGPSPDGSRAAVGVASQQHCGARVQLQLFDTKTGASIGGPWDTGDIVAMTWSPSGDRLLFVTKEGRLRALNPGTGAIKELADVGPILSFDVHPSGNWVATADGKTLGIVPLTPQGPPRRTLPERVTQVRFSPKGDLLAGATEAAVLLLDAATGERRAPPIADVRSAVRLAWSDDGLRLAAAFGRNNLALTTLRGASRSPVAPPSGFATLRRLKPPEPPKQPPILQQGRLAGRVLSRDGKPVPGAKVEFSAQESEWPNAKALGTRVFHAGADGSFDLQKLPRINSVLRWTAPGMRPEQLHHQGRDDKAPTRLDVNLDFIRGLLGTVVSLEGKPLAGVSVMRWESKDSEGSWMPFAVTDAKGQFVLEDVHDSYSIPSFRVLLPDGAIGIARPQSPLMPGVNAFTLTVRPRTDPAVLRLRVVHDSGSPVVDAKVSVEWESGRTDAQGRFHTLVEHSSGVRVSARPKPGGFYSARGLGEPFPEEVLIRVPDGQIHVLHAEGENTNVILSTLDAPRDDEGEGRGPEASKEGTRFLSLTGGSYRIVVQEPSGRWSIEPVRLGTGEQRVVRPTLKAPVSLSGRIIDAVTKKPVSGVRVEADALSAPSGRSTYRYVARVETLTREDGSFVLERMVPGWRVLELRVDGYQDRSALVEVGAKAETQAAPILLWPGEPRSYKQRMAWPGFSTTRQPEGCRVSSLYPWSPRGIFKGDLILRVNQRSVTGLEWTEILALMDDSPRVVLEVQGLDDVRRTVELPPRY